MNSEDYRILPEVFKCFTTLFATKMCSMVGLGNAEAKIEAADEASGRPSLDTQFSEAVRPRSCVFSPPDSLTSAAFFFSTFC